MFYLLINSLTVIEPISAHGSIKKVLLIAVVLSKILQRPSTLWLIFNVTAYTLSQSINQLFAFGKMDSGYHIAEGILICPYTLNEMYYLFNMPQ